jgi:YegS/Rv2252/BmrU family lipid kinase
MPAPGPVVIANPRAGQKGGITTNRAGPAQVQEILARHGIEADLWLTEYAHHATVLARRAAEEGRPLAIAAGGDGTVTEVAAGLVNSRTRLGLMPLGSVMNLARMLGVPRNLDAAAETIRLGHAVRIDAGRVTTVVGSRIFLEAAGAGVSAALFVYANELDKQNWRSLRAMVNYLLRYQPRRVRVTIDGQIRRTRASMITVANGPLIGANFEIAPGASLDDRHFNVRIFRAFTKRRLVGQLLAILTRRVGRQPEVITAMGCKVEIIARHPMMVHADSEPLGTTPATFELIPAALSVIVPGTPECEPALEQMQTAPANSTEPPVLLLPR